MLFNCGLRATLHRFAPCLASLGHLTADKREIKDFLKLPSATFFIRKTLSEIASTPAMIKGPWKV